MKKRFMSLGLLGVLIFLPALAQGQSDPDSTLIEGAKNEGKVMYYTTMTLSQSTVVAKRFEQKYPFLKAELYRTGGGPLLDKILTEARGGLYAWDVAVGRGEMVLPLLENKLLAVYRSPEAKAIDSDLVDPEGYWTTYYVNPIVLGYNTDRVRKADIPRTYEDLLDPQWRGGKISIDTENFSLLAGLIRAWGREKAVAYFKSLAAQDPVLMRGNTNRVQLTLAGEYPLVIAYAPTIQRQTSIGAPIDWLPLEPAVVQVNPALLAAHAPHPNAAKLLINFLLSQEGQKMLVEFKRIPVRREIHPDPPRLLRGYKRIVERPEDDKNFSEVVKLYEQIFHLR